MSNQRRVVIAEPENSETPLESQAGWVTPNRLFFVRNHFARPTIDLDAWRLSVEGAVRRPRQWTWDELNDLPQRTVFATVECAGNGRSFLQPRAAGVQWAAGAIGHAEWTGVPLRTILDEAGVQPEAVEIVFEGADQGSEADHPEPMHFERALPLAKALHPDTLLATRMNGEPLEADHGFPLRLFVPGWYGVASVKWLVRIAVIDRPFAGYFQTTKYTVRRHSGTGIETALVGPMAVKSEILRPRQGELLGLGRNRVVGLAWAGEEAVARVEISVNAHDWTPAELIGPRAPYSWTLFEATWQIDTSGDHLLYARAISESGQVQPAEHDPLHGGYLIAFSRPTRVRVAATTELGGPQPGDWEALLYDMNAFAEENARRPLDVDLQFAAGAGI